MRDDAMCKEAMEVNVVKVAKEKKTMQRASIQQGGNENTKLGKMDRFVSIG